MILEAEGLIIHRDNNYVLLTVPLDNSSFIDKQNITEAKVIFHDGRIINREQQKKIYAIIGDIAEYNGDEPEYLKHILKNDFLEVCGGEYFSLATCTVTTASDFIHFLISFCFSRNIPTRDTMLNRTDDIYKYLYTCLYYRKCCICNDKAEIHHCSDSRVGMGFSRNKIDNIGRSAIALCRKHHSIAHNAECDFFEKYHVYGIPLDNMLIKKLKL